MSTEEVAVVRGLCKDYPHGFLQRSRKTALCDVSFTIRGGSIFALLGPNGAGKSTTIHLMTGFLIPTAGSIRIRDQAPSSHLSRRSLGFLPEVFAFDRFATGRQLLERFDALSGHEASTRSARVDEVLQLVDLGDDARRKVGTYSKGMTQRIGLAQALLGDPELLILDEPMSGMDPANRRAVKDLLGARRSRGRATILSSHVLADIEELADEVLILNRGRVVANAPLSELRRPSTAKRIVFEAPADVAVDGELQSILSRARRESDGQAWSVEVEDDPSLNATLAILTGAGARIASVNPCTTDLEELFLQLTDGSHPRIS